MHVQWTAPFRPWQRLEDIAHYESASPSKYAEMKRDYRRSVCIMYEE
jgi:hypothetical protein